MSSVDEVPAGSPDLTAQAPDAAGKVLTTDELRQDKVDRHVFQERERLPIRVVLDCVRQGYNVGALFRLCDAFLCEELVICGRDSSHGTRKLVQAAQGSHRWVPWRQMDSTTEVVQMARADGYRIVAVELTSRSVSLEAFVPNSPVCLVLGSERSGVSQSVLDLADIAVAIPMRGMANSLNVATAAAIVLHQMSRTMNERAAATDGGA